MTILKISAGRFKTIAAASAKNTGCFRTISAAAAIRYGFVHGNWALDNSRPDGRRCGVNNELDVLRETGCYADFTLPSYPSPTQTRKINSIYYAVDDPVRPKSHDWGQDAGCGCQPDNSLMLIQGPLMLNWHSRKFGLLPRIENGNIQANQAPAAHRLDVWLKARVQVKTRRDWFFVKLHTHGAVEANQKVLLGDEMVKFHEEFSAPQPGQSEFPLPLCNSPRVVQSGPRRRGRVDRLS